MSERAYMRIVEVFDKDPIAPEFLSDDGDGGFAGGVSRMAREVAVQRARIAELEKALRWAMAEIEGRNRYDTPDQHDMAHDRALAALKEIDQ